MIKTKYNTISQNYRTYFIADISANHDGSLDRALELIRLAALKGANAAKFQNFQAKDIVSDYGFKKIGSQSHQANWHKSVYEVYKSASIPWEWTPILKNKCDEEGIDFFSTPYDINSINMLDNYVDIFKLGSGDITWLDLIHSIALTGKPILIACGASNFEDIDRAIKAFKSKSEASIVLMQCNTNYTASNENYNFINLNVLKSFKEKYPECILGLSDHTLSHATTLGAYSLGARVIEKHFTDDNKREGPDHSFSIMPKEWAVMVERTRELELAMGSKDKFIELNEKETVVAQRRAIRTNKFIKKGEILSKDDVVYLRPCPVKALNPYENSKVIGKKTITNIEKGDCVYLKDLMI